MPIGTKAQKYGAVIDNKKLIAMKNKLEYFIAAQTF